MATLEELLAEQARRQQPAAAPLPSAVTPSGEPLIPPGAPLVAAAPAAMPPAAAPTGAPTLDQLLAEQARRGAPVEEPPIRDVTREESQRAATPFPMDPSTSALAVHTLPELAGLSSGLNEFLPEDVSWYEALPQATAMLTMTDPQEIATMLEESFPDTVGIQYAPDGTIIIRNTKTHAAALLNRPGFSAMDAVQALGLMASFSPGMRWATKSARAAAAGKQIVTQTARRAARQKWKTAGRTAVASGGTETVLQAGQAAAGGEFDVGDIIFSTVLGAAPDIIAEPAMRWMHAARGILKPIDEMLPKSMVNALKVAKEKGLIIATSDALWDALPPFAQTAFSAAKRLPFFLGTGKQQTTKTAERVDLLTDLANDFDIDITTELGQDVSDSILQAMINKRFWGKNKEPSLDQIRKAWTREVAEVEDKVLKKYLDKGEMTSDLMDAVFDAGRPGRVTQLFERLDKNGQLAGRKRLITNGLVEAGWNPSQPGAADPAKFYKYLNSQNIRKDINIFFNEADRNVLDGVREYLRVTGRKAPSDAGPSLAMAALIMGFSGIAGPTVRVLETAPVRQMLLKMRHAKGNDKLIESLMEGVRPAILALTNQAYSENSNIEIADITPDMIKEMGEEAGDTEGMEYLRGLVPRAGEAYEDITASLQGMLQ